MQSIIKNRVINSQKNITATDKNENIISAEYAEYNEKTKILRTVGPTQIQTSQKYSIQGKNIIFDNDKRYIRSEENTILVDQENNVINLENFDYQTKNSIFKSIGLIKIKDKQNNTYEFSQIYIDTKKKEILGTDIKAYINDNSLKVNEKNKPRIFSNTIKSDSEKSLLKKVYLLFAIIEKMTNVPHGQYKLHKCYMIIRKKQFFMIMLL